MSAASGPNSTSVNAKLAAPIGRSRRRRVLPLPRLSVLACQIVGAAILLALWQWLADERIVSVFLYGSPSTIGDVLLKGGMRGTLWRDMYVTASETLAGFLFGNAVGVTIGLLLWYSRFLSLVIEPFIMALGSIPIIALAPITIIWFGTGFASKVAMSTLSVVVVAIIIAYKGARGVDPDQINLMRSLGARRGQIFRYLIVSASMTDIFAGLKLTVGFALVGAIVGEFMSSSEGLGHQIFKSGSLYAIPAVLGELVATVVLALILSGVVARIEQWLLPWRHDLS